MTLTASKIARPHALYRFFDAEGLLLYIGITNDLGVRLTGHSGDKGWWVDVVRVDVEHFSDRRAVLDAERAAILAEHPRHNVQYNEAVTMGEIEVDDPWAAAPKVGPEAGLILVGDELAIGTKFGEAPSGTVTYVDDRGLRMSMIGPPGTRSPRVVLWSEIAQIRHGQPWQLWPWCQLWESERLPQVACAKCSQPIFVTHATSGLCPPCWDKEAPF